MEPTTPLAEEPSASQLITIEDFGKVALRVARIEAAEAVPKSKKLLRLSVDVGPHLGKRQILSGIAQHYTPESLVGKKIIIVANLQPAKLMGLESEGMLLAASDASDTVVRIIEPPEESDVGSTVR